MRSMLRWPKPPARYSARYSARSTVTPAAYRSSMLLRSVCPICRRPGGVPCGPCREQLRPAPSDAPVPAIIAYEGVGRELLARLKYRDARQAVAPLADALAVRAADAGC